MPKPPEEQSTHHDPDRRAGEETLHDVQAEQMPVLIDRNDVAENEEWEHQAERRVGALSRDVRHRGHDHRHDHEAQPTAKSAFGDADEKDAERDEEPPEGHE